jgi:hypothetical protein
MVALFVTPEHKQSLGRADECEDAQRCTYLPLELAHLRLPPGGTTRVHHPIPGKYPPYREDGL